MAPRYCHTQVCYLFVCFIGCYCSPEVWACWLVSSLARQAEEAQLSHRVSDRLPACFGLLFPKDSLQKKMHHVRIGRKTSRFYSSCKFSTKSDRCCLCTGTFFSIYFTVSKFIPATSNMKCGAYYQESGHHLTALHSQHANNALWIALFITIISVGKECSCL